MILQKTLHYGGVTCKFPSKIFIKKLDTWIFPKYPNKTIITPLNKISFSLLYNFIRKNYTQLCEKDCTFGTWINPKNNFLYLDINTSIDNTKMAIQRAKHITYSKKRRIVAIYNPKKNITLYLS